MTTEIEHMNRAFALGWIVDENPPPNRNACGYGSKIPTPYRIKCRDGRTRRVYAICYSNAGSVYILVKGKMYYIHDYDVPDRTRMAVGA